METDRFNSMETDRLKFDELDFHELKNIDGGLDETANGCGICNGRCTGGGGCGICNGICQGGYNPS